MKQIDTKPRQGLGQRMGYVQDRMESMEDLVGLLRAMVSAYDRYCCHERLSTNAGPLREAIVMEARMKKPSGKLLSTIARKGLRTDGQGRSGVGGSI